MKKGLSAVIIAVYLFGASLSAGEKGGVCGIGWRDVPYYIYFYMTMAGTDGRIKEVNGERHYCIKFGNPNR